MTYQIDIARLLQESALSCRTSRCREDVLDDDLGDAGARRTGGSCRACRACDPGCTGQPDAARRTRAVLWSTRHKRGNVLGATLGGMSDAIHNQYAVAALKARRAVLAGELAQLESHARLKAEDLSHVDAVLRMFAPEVDPNALPKRHPRRDNPYAIPNASRRILGILRRRGEPMSTPDVIDALSAEMAFGTAGDHTVAARVRYALRDLAKEGGPVLKTGWRAEAMWSAR